MTGKEHGRDRGIGGSKRMQGESKMQARGSGKGEADLAVKGVREEQEWKVWPGRPAVSLPPSPGVSLVDGVLRTSRKDRP